MHIVLFILYGLLLGFLLLKLPVSRNSGIRPLAILTLFGLHVLMGHLHTWVAWRFFPNHGDIWLFFHDSFTTRSLLFHDLRQFWLMNSAWYNLPHNLIEWLHILFNFLSFDDLYINTLLFSGLTLSGHLAMFLVLYRRSGNNIFCGLSAMLLPSILFWTSCIHTEGIVYACLGWLIYDMDRMFRNGWSTPRVIRCLLLTALCILFRPGLAFGLLPALIAWPLAESGASRRTWLRIGAGAAVCIIAVLIGAQPLLLSVLKFVSERQQEFQALTGGSRIDLPLLYPTWSSFWQVLPAAAVNGLFQPLPGSGGQVVYSAFSAELLFTWAVIAFSVFNHFTRRTSLQTPSPASEKTILVTIPGSDPLPVPVSVSAPVPIPIPAAAGFASEKPAPATGTVPSPQHTAPGPFTLFCLVFALPGMLIIGYMVPFVGAIVRYRSIYWPFLLWPFLSSLNSHPAIARLNIYLTHKLFQSHLH